MTDREFTLRVVAALVWWIVGVAGFTYWWTTDHVLTISSAILGCIMGCMGPLTWIVGGFIHGGW